MEKNIDLNLRIILLSGPVAVGKSTVASRLVAYHGFERVRSGNFLQQRAMDLGLSSDRSSLQSLGDDLDIQTDYQWLISDVVVPAVQLKPTHTHWLIDAVRKKRQVENFRSKFGAAITHVYLDAKESTLKLRYAERMISGEEYYGKTTYEQAIEHPNEIASRSMRHFADIVLHVEGKTPEQLTEIISEKIAKR